MKQAILIFLYVLLFDVSVQAREIAVLYGKLPPYMYMADNRPAGFYYELLALMKKQMAPITFTYQYLPVKRMILTARLRPDTMCLGLTRNPERESLYKWVGPSISRRVGAYRLKSRPDLVLETEADFKTYRFGAGLGFAAIQDLMAYGVPKVHIEEVSRDSANITKLVQGKIDFYASIDVVAVQNAELEGISWEKFHCAYILNDRYQLYYAFHPETQDSLIREFQQALDTVKSAGAWDVLVSRYRGK